MSHWFSGSAMCAVDEDGFLTLPEFVRLTLSELSEANLLVIAPHLSEPCLIGYDRSHHRVLHADQERLRSSRYDADQCDARARHIFGWAEEARYEPDGKMSLPVQMRRKGGVDGLALFVGVGATFEIWNPRIALESGDPALSEIATWRSQSSVQPLQEI